MILCDNCHGSLPRTAPALTPCVLGNEPDGGRLPAADQAPPLHLCAKCLGEFRKDLTRLAAQYRRPLPEKLAAG